MGHALSLLRLRACGLCFALVSSVFAASCMCSEYIYNSIHWFLLSRQLLLTHRTGFELTDISNGCYGITMNDVQEKIAGLQSQGWSLAALADELGVHHNTVKRWRSSDRYPENVKPVLMAMDTFMKRKPPPRRRYPGTHHLQRKGRKE